LKVGVLAGSFNPPTIAHLHLLEAARDRVDELVCVLPRTFPHKVYHGATLEQRIEMLQASGLPERCSIAVSEGGLFAEIAEECHRAYSVPVQPQFICGRDAAQRIVEWNYGGQGVIEAMLERFELLAAPRDGHYEPPAHLRGKIHLLPVTRDLDAISSSEVRSRISNGAAWEQFVADGIVEMVRRIYS
jgi:cytidyltransferase-like protein